MLSELSQRASAIPSPVSRYGSSQLEVELKTLVYDGQSLPRFLKLNGGDPQRYGEFLRLNQLTLEDLYEPGHRVVVPQYRDRFSAHPEG